MKLERVLLVDDDEISNHVSRSAIQRVKMANQIVIKSDGKDAIEYIQNDCVQWNQFPDLIFLDLKMPGMDGFDFIKSFDKISNLIKKKIVIVILTSSQNADDIIRLRKLGNYFLINKPLTADKVIDIHHRYFRDRTVLY
jgi:CheY-like chemotaxis protein